MVRLILLFLVVFHFSATAQLQPIYLLKNSIIFDKKFADSYGVYGKLTDKNLFVLKIYDLNDNLKTEGSYKDSLLIVPHGDFIYYETIAMYNAVNRTHYQNVDKSVFVVGKGSFIDGKQEGVWLSFYPDGKLRTQTTYKNGLKEGPYAEYKPSGWVILQGSFKDNMQDGEWYYRNGKGKLIYNKGILKNKNGKVLKEKL